MLVKDTHFSIRQRWKSCFPFVGNNEACGLQNRNQNSTAGVTLEAKGMSVSYLVAVFLRTKRYARSLRNN